MDAIARTPQGRWKIRTGEAEFETGAVVLATGIRHTERLMNTLAGAGAQPGAYKPFEFERFVSAPITTIHLWYDREVAGLDHAVLLDTRIQWLFAKSRIRGWEPSRGSYLELVISASWPEIALSREHILPCANSNSSSLPCVRPAC